MDLAQAFIVDVGWVFFISWAMVLAAVSIVAFGRDISLVNRDPRREKNFR